jgi:hypothetical protein
MHKGNKETRAANRIKRYKTRSFRRRLRGEIKITTDR